VDLDLAFMLDAGLGPFEILLSNISTLSTFIAYVHIFSQTLFC
jgi:hypothetical protein